MSLDPLIRNPNVADRPATTKGDSPLETLKRSQTRENPFEDAAGKLSMVDGTEFKGVIKEEELEKKDRKKSEDQEWRERIALKTFGQGTGEEERIVLKAIGRCINCNRRGLAGCICDQCYDESFVYETLTDSDRSEVADREPKSPMRTMAEEIDRVNSDAEEDEMQPTTSKLKESLIDSCSSETLPKGSQAPVRGGRCHCTLDRRCINRASRNSYFCGHCVNGCTCPCYGCRAPEVDSDEYYWSIERNESGATASEPRLTQRESEEGKAEEEKGNSTPPIWRDHLATDHR